MTNLSFQEWKTKASKLNFRNQAFIGGNFVNSVSGKTLASINPATGDVQTQVSECDYQDIDLAVIAARRAFEKGHWLRMAPADRKAVLLKLSDLIRENLVELALLDRQRCESRLHSASEILSYIVRIRGRAFSGHLH